MEVNYLAIVAAAVASFVISSVWYAVFDRQRTELLGGADAAAGGRPPAWKVLVELFRSLVVASVLAGLAARMEITDWTGAALLGSAAWIGFPFVLLTARSSGTTPPGNSPPSTRATGWSNYSSSPSWSASGTESSRRGRKPIPQCRIDTHYSLLNMLIR